MERTEGFSVVREDRVVLLQSGGDEIFRRDFPAVETAVEYEQFVCVALNLWLTLNGHLDYTPAASGELMPASVYDADGRRWVNPHIVAEVDPEPPSDAVERPAHIAMVRRDKADAMQATLNPGDRVFIYDQREGGVRDWRVIDWGEITPETTELVVEPWGRSQR